MASDEGQHDPDLSDPLWNESWYLDWAAPDGSVGGYVRFGLYPTQGVAWVWACCVGEDLPLVMHVDHEAPPALPTGYVVEADGERVRVSFESDRVALRYDLTWETAGGIYPYPGTTRYEVPCRVRGEVEADGRVVEVDAPGERDHSWGHRDWWSFGWVWTAGAFADGSAFHAADIRIPGLTYRPGFVVPAGGGALRELSSFSTSETVGGDGLPVAAEMALEDVTLAVAPRHWASVPMEAPDGRTATLARALCRFDASDGRSGFGWTEWNLPHPGDG